MQRVYRELGGMMVHRNRFRISASLILAFLTILGAAACPIGLAEPIRAQGPAEGGVVEATPADGEATAESAPVEAVVVRIIEAGMVESMGAMQPYQILEMRLVRPQSGAPERVQVRNSLSQGGVVGVLEVGDRVWLQPEMDRQGQPAYFIAARSRWQALSWGLVAFVALVVVVGQWHGVRALLGLVLSFVVVFAYIIPRIADGASPVGVTLLGLGVSMPFSYYLAHGVSRKSTVALLGSLIALGFTGLLALRVVSTAHLTGLASEEAVFLLGVYGRDIDLTALLLAGVLIAILGVLDDITVAQAAVVEQLVDANPKWPRETLFLRAMSVGRDHIASMVNTLVLVYAGSALPLLLLLTNRQLPLAYTVSYELVAEEIVRILVTSIGLIAAVPVTTLLAATMMGPRAGRRADRALPPYA